MTENETQETDLTSMEMLACGCRNTIQNGQTVQYDPCLACALTNAGVMLQAAGARLHEAEEHEQREQQERNEEARKEAERWIGGSD